MMNCNIEIAPTFLIRVSVLHGGKRKLKIYHRFYIFLVSMIFVPPGPVLHVIIGQEEVTAQQSLRTEYRY
jgi:hypothetical protein